MLYKHSLIKIAYSVLLLGIFIVPLVAMGIQEGEKGVIKVCNPETGECQYGSGSGEEDIANQGLRGAGKILNILGPSAGFQQASEPEVVAGKIIQGALVIMGTIFGILVIYGGYLWMQARGNEEYVKKAKGILEAAIIGIVIVMGAYAITAFIVDRVITAAQFGQ